MIEIFYIGRSFFEQSGGSMGIYYTLEKERIDWFRIENLLREEKEVKLRLANDEELLWANEHFKRIMYN